MVIGADDMVLIGRDAEDYFYMEYEISGGQVISGTTLAGGGGDDRFVGTIGDDEFYGGEGNDLFIASGGSDLIFGGSGDDSVRNMQFPTRHSN